MKPILPLFLLLLLLTGCRSHEATLRSAFDGQFLIGSCVGQRQVSGRDQRGDSVLLRHFNAIEPENCLKSSSIMPRWGVYRWADADAYVDFGTSHGLYTVGHCLIWHSQLTRDFCYDADGNLLTADSLKARMKEYITTVVGRYRGRIKAWDVCNETILEDGSYRRSPFYQILGEEYIPWAFQCAHEADPDCYLILNDYSMYEPAKVERYIAIVRDLQQRGIRIDALGFQGHLDMHHPDLDAYERLIRRVYDETGIHVCFTELDLSILPSVVQGADLGGMNVWQAMRDTTLRERLEPILHPYPDGVPQERLDEWNARYDALFRMFLRNAHFIDRVNLWGISDGDSWKNGFPIPGRTDYPLLFGRDYRLKPFAEQLIAERRKKKMKP